MPLSEAVETDRLLAEFRGRAEPLGVRVERAGSLGVAAEMLRERTLGTADRVVVAAEVVARWPEIVGTLESAGLGVDVAHEGDPPAEAPVGISLARLAVAETGSVLLAEFRTEDRAVSMLTLAHATICPISRLVASLDDAVGELRRVAEGPGPSFQTFVTGPSRTADIERVLTVGVQGPGRVMTIFVDGA